MAPNDKTLPRSPVDNNLKRSLTSVVDIWAPPHGRVILRGHVGIETPQRPVSSGTRQSHQGDYNDKRYNGIAQRDVSQASAELRDSRDGCVRGHGDAGSGACGG
jgi:hypothetical protein